MNIAFLGLGDMGLQMALHLQRKGFTVTGWNRSPGKGQALADAGGRLAATPREACSGADAVITMLGGPSSIREVAEGTDGFLAACRQGALWIDSSTIGPTAARAMGALAARYNVAFVDAPVTGSVPQATEGELVFLVGGTEADVQRAQPLFAAMGKLTHHFGPVGQGAAAKAISNQLVGTQIVALAEALVLAETLGLDRSRMADFLADGPGGSRTVRGKGALMKAGEYPPSFRLKWMEKDMWLALKEALNSGVQLPVTGGAQAMLAAARADGLGEYDVAAVFAHFSKVAAGRPDAD
ncbi:MAG TPA: NAD(P)-dependent oxidoreductase [Symbiobacteriaceae bacterium]|nr:NAD(P)-dependent oxidoreductase [Symbiobacteriaceae bacterium]